MQDFLQIHFAQMPVVAHPVYKSPALVVDPVCLYHYVVEEWYFILNGLAVIGSSRLHILAVVFYKFNKVVIALYDSPCGKICVCKSRAVCSVGIAPPKPGRL